MKSLSQIGISNQIWHTRCQIFLFRNRQSYG